MQIPAGICTFRKPPGGLSAVFKSLCRAFGPSQDLPHPSIFLEICRFSAAQRSAVTEIHTMIRSRSSFSSFFDMPPHSSSLSTSRFNEVLRLSAAQISAAKANHRMNSSFVKVFSITGTAFLMILQAGLPFPAEV